MVEVLEKLYEMTSFQELFDSPGNLLMLIIGLGFMYLGVQKRYEPLLLVPIAFGIMLANFPGANMAVVPVAFAPEIEHMTLMEISKNFGIMNLLYYSLIKTGLLPPLIFYGSRCHDRFWATAA